MRFDGVTALLSALSPKVPKSTRRQLGVTHRVLNVLVAEIGLQGARVVSLVGQGEATGMAEHVRVCLELQPCGFSGTLYHARESCRGER